MGCEQRQESGGRRGDAFHLERRQTRSAAGKGEYPAQGRRRRIASIEEERVSGEGARRQRTCANASMKASVGKCLNLSLGLV